MKYMCLAYEEEQTFHDMSPEEWHALRQETLDYVEMLRASGRLIAAHPLQSATTASTVRIRDGRLLVTDGPFAETKEQLAGFYLVDAVDLNDAIRIASQIPPARVGSIEVRPVRELNV